MVKLINSIFLATLVAHFIGCSSNFAQQTDDLSERFFEVTDKDKRYIILQITRLGLANRLRSVADWYVIGRLTNRDLLVSWEPTIECNISFNELFDDGPPGLSLLPIFLPQGGGEKLISDMAKTINSTYFNMDSLSGDKKFNEFFVDIKEVESLNFNIIYTSYDGIKCSNKIKSQQYMYMRSNFYQQLRPNPFIIENINHIINSYFSNNIMIGVHIRMYDPKFDWEIVPPRNGLHKASAFGDGASVEDFKSILNQIKTQFTIEVNDKPLTNCRFLIASNSESIKKYFLHEFPGSIAISGEQKRESRDGITLALLEFLLLSKSALIINTYGSSFAVEAAAIHMRPLVGLWDSQLLYYNDIRLPYGGHIHFAVASGLGEKYSYHEGTFENREVEGYQLRMDNCHGLLSDFGLNNIYCLQKD